MTTSNEKVTVDSALLPSSPSTILATNVRNLMTRKGIRRNEHAKKLSEILDLSHSQSHRKLNGLSAWDINQIKRVAEAFDEPFTAFETAFLPQVLSSQNAPELIPATFYIEGRKLPCLIATGPQLHATSNVDYVALKKGEEWAVVEASTISGDSAPYKVTKIELEIRQTRQLRIAVLDDHTQSADNLCDYLKCTGFAAEVFYDADAFLEAMSEKHFDAYVIDWILGSGTAEPLIREIRATETKPTPILLFTGELTTGKTNDSEMARLISTYNVDCHEKPHRLPMIAAELSKALGV